MPVCTSQTPVPSTLTVTETSVSLVVRETVATRDDGGGGEGEGDRLAFSSGCDTPGADDGTATEATGVATLRAFAKRGQESGGQSGDDKDEKLRLAADSGGAGVQNADMVVQRPTGTRQAIS